VISFFTLIFVVYYHTYCTVVHYAVLEAIRAVLGLWNMANLTPL